MRKVVLVAYYQDEQSIKPDATGVWYDVYGLTKLVEQVTTDFDYSDKLDISPKDVTLFGKYNAPTTQGYTTMSQSEKDYLSVFSLPLLGFYDPDANHFYGILAKQDFKYNAIKSSLDVIANTKSFDEQKGYEVQLGDQTYFYRDARNAHLTAGGSDPNPKHSLLDAVYLGADLGIFDRPYLRDFVSEMIDSIKKYWWILPVVAGGYVAFKYQQHKVRNTRYIKYVRGSAVNGRKKKKTPLKGKVKTIKSKKRRA